MPNLYSGRIARAMCWPLFVSCLGLLSACSTEDPQSELAVTRAALISDQLHEGGTAGFFWLPPIVPRPAPFGEVVVDADPTVRIDRINPTTGATLATVATFTRQRQGGNEWVRLKQQGQPCDP